MFYILKFMHSRRQALSIFKTPTTNPIDKMELEEVLDAIFARQQRLEKNLKNLLSVHSGRGRKIAKMTVITCANLITLVYLYVEAVDRKFLRNGGDETNSKALVNKGREGEEPEYFRYLPIFYPLIWATCLGILTIMYALIDEAFALKQVNDILHEQLSVRAEVFLSNLVNDFNQLNPSAQKDVLKTVGELIKERKMLYALTENAEGLHFICPILRSFIINPIEINDGKKTRIYDYNSFMQYAATKSPGELTELFTGQKIKTISFSNKLNEDFKRYVLELSKQINTLVHCNTHLSL